MREKIESALAAADADRDSVVTAREITDLIVAKALSVIQLPSRPGK
jgi:hypothetical protein